MSPSYKQMKLISGEEIICEVVYWPEEGNDDNTMIIRSAAELAMHEDLDEAIRFYTFRPYMMYISDDEQLITLNGNNITSITTPHPEMMKQYRDHMKIIRKQRSIDIASQDSDQPANVLKFRPRYH